MHSFHWPRPAASPQSRTTKPHGLQHIPLFWLLWVSFLLTAPCRQRTLLTPPHSSELLFAFKFLSFCSFVKIASLQVFQSFSEASQRHKALYFWIATLVISSRWLRVRSMCVGAHDTSSVSKVTSSGLPVFRACLIDLGHVACGYKVRQDFNICVFSPTYL